MARPRLLTAPSDGVEISDTRVVTSGTITSRPSRKSRITGLPTSSKPRRRQSRHRWFGSHQVQFPPSGMPFPRISRRSTGEVRPLDETNCQEDERLAELAHSNCQP